jgi:gas vesicle protein
MTKKSVYQQKESAMGLSKDQEELYKRTMDEVRRQLDNLDDEVEKELQKVRRRLAELQES